MDVRIRRRNGERAEFARLLAAIGSPSWIAAVEVDDLETQSRIWPDQRPAS